MISVSLSAWTSLAGLAVLTLTPAQRLVGQLCRPPASSHEAKTLAIFAVPLAFGPATAPGDAEQFLGLEGSSLPKISRVIATPTTCQPGKGPENTDLLFAVPRPRIGLWLPLGFSVQASWVPPIRLEGVKANLFGISLGHSFGLGSFAAAVRAHATLGSINAPITCPQAAIVDPTSECFKGSVSNDRLSPNIVGVDFSVARSTLGGRLRPYIGAGYNRLEPRFRVDYKSQGGFVDRTLVEVNLDRAVVFGGASWIVVSPLTATGEIYAAPGDAVTVRLVLRTVVRR